MSRFKLALRLLWRDTRSGELTALLCALIIAVASSTAIAVFSDRLQLTMTTQTAEFIAADLAVASPDAMPGAWRAKAAQLQLSQAQTVEFSSVLIEHDELLLASVKAVSSRYPLRGFLKTANGDTVTETIAHQGPETGAVWVDKRVLSALKLQLGDTLNVGEKALTIQRIITYEPDKQGNYYSFSPRIMINDGDLQATGIIQPGSHVHYVFQFIGTSPALAAFSDWLKPQLTAAQRLLDIHKDRPELGSALDRTQRYLGLSSMLVVIISGVAIAMAARRYSERHFDSTALLRCLGCRQRDLLWLFVSQFIVLGLIASCIGGVFGWFAQQGLFLLLKDLLPQQLAAPSILSLGFGFIIALTALLGFALPPLLRLKQVSPLRVLRRDLAPLPGSAWLSYGLALTVIGLLLWQYTGDLDMTATLLGMGAATVLALGMVLSALLDAAGKWLPLLGLRWRFGVQGLTRDRPAAVSQILAFSITMVAMILSFTVHNDVIRNWQQHLPEKAPNHFALNIFPDQLDAFRQTLEQQQISGSRFYPVTRGRLTAINNTPVQQAASKDSSGELAIHRELSLTWAQQLPDENKITAGSWWLSERPGRVSVEQKLAESLHIKVGDRLTFTVTSRQFQADVTSIRSLRWDTMKPNFYMVFSPGTLDGYPSTYLTSFYLAPEQKNLLNTLVKQYPGITVMEVEQILHQIKTILTHTTQAVNYLLYFAIMAGIAVLYAAVYASLDSRIYESALMRALGANRGLLRSAHIIEFSLLGGLSGVLAVIISEALLYALYSRVIDIAYHPNFYLWLLVPLAGALSVALTGCWGLRGVLDKAPLCVLREL